MDLLFVNPWIFDFAAYDFWLAPLGLLRTAGLVREATGARIHWIDCLDRRHPGLPAPPLIKADGRGHYPKTEVPKPAVLKGVPRRFSRYGIPVEVFDAELERLPAVPQAVFLTGLMTYWYPGIQLVVERVRKRFGGVPIVLGGIYATLCGEHARRESGADVVVAGPAEPQIEKLLREILGDGFPRPSKRDGGSRPSRPAFDLLRDRSWLPLLTSRGCPFRCSFCAGRALFPGFEEYPPSDAIAEILDGRDRFGTRQFAFYDDALLLNKRRRIVPLLEDVVRRELGVAFHTPNGLHIREIDDDLAALFKKAGVASIFLSQESVDPAVLPSADGKVAAGDLERAAASLERAGYRRGDLNVYLIAGLPGQSAASIRADIAHVQRLGLRPRPAFFSPIPGTPVWAEMVAAGSIRADADPLVHNKAAYPYVSGAIDPEEWRSLHEFISGLGRPGAGG